MIVSAADIVEAKQAQQPRGKTAGVGTRGTNKINMEAYQAYHHGGGGNESGKPAKTTNEQVLLSQTHSEDPPPPISKDTADKNSKQQPPTTNSYTTVTQTQNGTNINITNINNHHTYVIYR